MSFGMAKQVRLNDTEVVNDERFMSPFALLTGLVIVICYWNIAHNWEASELVKSVAENYNSGDENFTADRIKDVNALSTTFRLLFAAWGCFCFAISPKSRLNTSSLLLWSILTVAVFLVASVFWSANPSQTIFKLAVLGTMAIGAAGIAAKFSLREFLSITTCVCLSFGLLGIVAEVLTGNFSPGSNHRFTGTTHPNTEAIFASFLCLISRLFLSKFGTRNFLGLGIFIFGMVVVWNTKSRTTLAGLLISLIVIQVLVARGSNRVLIVSGLLVLMSLGLAGSSMISQRSSGAFGSVANMGRNEDVSSLSGRLPLWEELIDSISKKPILGYGYLAYWDAKKVEELSANFRWEIPHGHNSYLDVLLDGGIVGLSLVMLAILFSFVEAARLYSSRNQIEYAIVFGLLAYAVINGLAESLFKLPGFALFVVLTCCFSMLKEEYQPRQR